RRPAGRVRGFRPGHPDQHHRIGPGSRHAIGHLAFGWAAPTISPPPGRRAADWDVDGDGRRDRARLAYLGGYGPGNWELVVNMTTLGQQTVRFTGEPVRSRIRPPGLRDQSAGNEQTLLLAMKLSPQHSSTDSSRSAPASAVSPHQDLCHVHATPARSTSSEEAPTPPRMSSTGSVSPCYLRRPARGQRSCRAHLQTPE